MLALLFFAAYAPLALVSFVDVGGRGATGVLVGTILPLSVHAVLGTLAAAVAIVVMHDGHLGRRTGLGAGAAELRPRWREVLAAALLAGVISLLVVLPPLSILAGLLGLTIFAVLHGPPIVIHAIVLEQRSLQQAWPRARYLLARSWGRLILHLLTIALGVRLLESVMTLVLAPLLGDFTATGTLTPTLVLADLVVLAVLVPFILATALAAFLDLRAMKDGPQAAAA